MSDRRPAPSPDTAADPSRTGLAAMLGHLLDRARRMSFERHDTIEALRAEIDDLVDGLIRHARTAAPHDGPLQASGARAEAPHIGHRFVLDLTRMAAAERHPLDPLNAYATRDLRWVLPALTHEERVATLQAMQAQSTAAVFAATVALCREVLAPEQWARLPEPVRAAA